MIRPILVAGFMAALVSSFPAEMSLATPAPGDDPAPKPAAPASGPPKPPAAHERFDKLVREDLFAGFGGDEKALERGLAKCDAALAADPKHAEALVWRGAVRVFRSSKLFGGGRFLAGMELWNGGIKDMDDAVALAPANPGVRIPRAAVLMPAARNAPAAMGAPLLKRALDDYQTMARLQADHLDELGEHPLGELRMGLADIYRATGDLAKSREQLELVRKELPDTDYAERAGKWLAARPDAKLAHQCIGCHGG